MEVRAGWSNKGWLEQQIIQIKKDGGCLMTFADFSLFIIAQAEGAMDPNSSYVTVSLNADFSGKNLGFSSTQQKTAVRKF